MYFLPTLDNTFNNLHNFVLGTSHKYISFGNTVNGHQLKDYS